MKVMTVWHTMEIIRLSQIIPKLTCYDILIHTGQNFDPNLSEIFYDLNIDLIISGVTGAHRSIGR